jgi:hypothetical protein
LFAYIVGTRGKGEVSTGTNHLGFRCVQTREQWHVVHEKAAAPIARGIGDLTSCPPELHCKDPRKITE